MNNWSEQGIEKNRPPKTIFVWNLTLELDVDSVSFVDVFFVVVGSPRPEVVDLLPEVDEQRETLFGQWGTQKFFRLALFVLKIWKKN